MRRGVEDGGGSTYHGAAAPALGGQVFPLQPEQEAGTSASLSRLPNLGNVQEGPRVRSLLITCHGPSGKK